MLLLSQYNYNQHLVCNNFNILVTLSLAMNRILDVPTFNTWCCIKTKTIVNLHSPNFTSFTFFNGNLTQWCDEWDLMNGIFLGDCGIMQVC